MSDHEFEKQVQRKMDELKIRPSDAVWTEVQKNIRQTRRRRFRFWLPVFFVFLAATGYILYTHNQSSTLPIAKSRSIHNNLYNDNNATQKAQDKTLEATPSNDATLHNNDNAVEKSNGTPLQNNTTQPLNGTPSPGNATQPSNGAPSPGNAASPINGTSLSNKPAPFNTTNPANRPHNNTAINTTKNNRQPLVQPSLNNTPETIAETNKPSGRHHITKVKYSKPGNTSDIENAEPANTSAAENAAPENELSSTMPATAPRDEDPIATGKAAPQLTQQSHSKIFAPEKQNTAAAMPMPPIQKQKSPKWQWGIQASIGYSRISQSSLFDLKGLLGSQEKNRAEDLAMRSPAPQSYQGATYITVAPPIEKKAAPIESDLAYSMGVFVQRPLSKRLRLTIGLQYAYMSAHTNIGKLVQQSTNVNFGSATQRVVPSYYLAADTKDASQQLNGNYMPPADSLVSQKYTYRFHTIELPITINWQINKGRRLPPLVLDAGVSLAHMWSIDALHFDGIKGIYYKNDDLFNKTQFNAIMGLNVGLFQRSKFPVWIGPSFRYSVTGLLKKEVSKGQFLWSAGINLRVGLNRL